MKKKPGFSLIEVMVVVALLGILSSSVAVAINPAKRIAQARDARRKTDISVITNSLIEYEFTFGQYPARLGSCDSSTGRKNGNCPMNPPQSSWGFDSPIKIALVDQQKLLKQLPIDPKNDINYYYYYRPRRPTQQPCQGTGKYCRYWIGVRLESPKDPLKPIYRCSDNERLGEGTGCKEVANYNQ